MKPADIKRLLESRYDRANWQKLLHGLFPGCAELWSTPSPLALSADFPAAAQFGRILLADGRRIALIEVPVAGHIDLQRNRVGLRNLVARVIDGEAAHAVFGLFIDRAGGDYRFSFAARTHEIGADGDFSTRETAPRRYTYLLGPGRSCRTATERFAALGTLGSEATLAAITKAFSVEPLFKEFYKDYRAAFEAVENAIAPALPPALPERKEKLRLFTQRLFNRLMFLAFIERKHWLRFGSRTADYLAALYDNHRNAPAEHANFYRDRLVPLFFEGLNRPVRDTTFSDPRFGSVPYLNGGLFEKAEDGTDDPPGLVVPDEALARILDPEVGLFSRYNFTVAESTPLEVEVAVDPEMLGKVFEELVTGRHEQGSYYTPKPIVSFMARAALVEHLADRCTKESRAALEAFVHDHQAGGLKDHEAMLGALRTVTTCDPACGSGAYLLGMLHELLDLRTALVSLAPAAKLDAATAYDRKLEIISRNLYGVDLDPFAVNIARLRLWLSLIVEYEGDSPPPLPNLDFKIECGDSLAAPAPADAFADAMTAGDTVHQLAAKKSAYLRAHGAEKEKLRADIAALKQNLFGWVKADKNEKAFHWAVEFAEVFFPTPAGTAITGELNLGIAHAGTLIPGGFDVIVANPPYVRMELIKPIKPMLKKRYDSVHAERADLFVYFYARAHELLRPRGVAAFISSNKWLRAGYGEPLRQLLLDQQAFRLVMDFGELGVFDTAATDAAIFLWQKQERAKSATRWAMVKDLAQCYRDGVRNHFDQLAVTVPVENFGQGKPRLATVATADLRATMERCGKRLGEICKGLIGWGVKTGLNDAFIINRETRDRLIAQTPESVEIIKPMLAGDDVRRYETHSRDTYLIYAYHGVEMSRYPAVEKHLRPFRSYVNKKGEIVGLDHRATKQEWYELQQPQMAYRTWFDGPKIVYPEIGKEARFVLDESGLYLNNKCFFLPSGDWFLLGVLNSSSTYNYLREVCSSLGDKDDGGRLEFRAIYLETLPIPDASPADRQLIGDLAKQAQALHTDRRALVEQFLRDLGINPAESNSRSVLESPWTLAETEFVKRAKKKPLSIYHAARDATGALTERIAVVEAEIDRRVAVLYGLAPDTQDAASAAAPVAKGEEKEALFFKLLGELKSRSPYFSLDTIRQRVSDAGLTLKDSSLKVYLTEAVKLGRVHDAGRGWYSALSTRATLDPHPVAKLIRAVEKAFPLLDFSVWSTVQMNPWMHHLLAKPIHFLNAPAETLESVGESLRELGWDVSVNPPPSEASRRVRPGEKCVILRPMLTRAPLPTAHQAAMEAVIVDWLVESKSIGFVSSDEACAAAGKITETCLLEVASIHRYAESRKANLADSGGLIFVTNGDSVTKINDI